MTFHEYMRFEYPLTPDSVVLDCGVFEGDFAEGIASRYDCHVIGLEPITEFYQKAAKGLAKFPKVQLYKGAIGGSDREDIFGIQNNSSGLFADLGKSESAHVFSIVDVLKWPMIKGHLDLLKLNVEGAEFEVLEALLFNGVASRIANIQVQFHPCVEDAQSRYFRIRGGLLNTHRLTFDNPWTWEGYERL